MDFLEERRFEFDPASRLATATITYTFHRPENLGQATEAVRGRVVTRDEVEDCLGRTGYSTQAVWGDYERSPARDDSRRLIFVACKLP